jgi:hypothetical protein
VPAGLDPAQAVSLVLNYLSAWQMLHRCAHVAAGDAVLVHGAAGGVGTALLQLGRLAGLTCSGTASASGGGGSAAATSEGGAEVGAAISMSTLLRLARGAAGSSASSAPAAAPAKTHICGPSAGTSCHEQSCTLQSQGWRSSRRH